jgi:hypothetical protein
LALLACEHPEEAPPTAPARADASPPEVAPADAGGSPCTSGPVDPLLGGIVDAGGATLTVGPGVFVDQGVVTLCPARGPKGSSDAWSVSVDPEMTVYQPLQLAIRTADPHPAEALFVPGPDGTAVRSLLAAEDGDGVWSTPMWRTGTAWLGDDSRVIEPFAPTPSAVDLLIVMDDSCSMLDEQLKAGELLPGVLDRLDPFGVDYHVGVITTGSSAWSSFRGVSWIDRDTKRGDEVLAELLSVGNDSTADAGLASLWGAVEVQATNYAPANGFYRSDAALEVLSISGDDDRSPVTPEQVADALWSLGRPAIGASALIPTQGQDAGTEYVDLAKLVGGWTEDLDGDWSAVLDPLGDALILAAGMPLDPTAELWVVPPDAEPAPCVEPRVDDQSGRMACLDPLPDGTELVVLR